MKPIEGIFVQEVKWYCGSRAEKYFLTFADTLALFMAFWLAGKWTLDSSDLNSFGLDSSRLLSYSLLCLVTLAIFKLKGHHAKRRPYSNEIKELLKVAMVMGLIDAAWSSSTSVTPRARHYWPPGCWCHALSCCCAASSSTC